MENLGCGKAGTEDQLQDTPEFSTAFKVGTPNNCCLIFKGQLYYRWAPQVVPVVKNLTVNAGDIRDAGSIPGSGRSPGGGHGNSLQYYCLENPMDRGAWRLQSIGSQRVRHD